MAIITYLDPLEMLEQLFLGHQAAQDATRLAAQQEIARLIGSRVHRGRRPQVHELEDTIILSVVSTIPEIYLSAEDTQTTTEVMVRCLSDSDARAALAAEACRQLLTTYRGTVSTPAGDMCVGGIFPQALDSPEPEPPDDGSPWFEFEYNRVYRIVHEIVSPTGAN